jgi:uncharacterized protein (DUF885 family)
MNLRPIFPALILFGLMVLSCKPPETADARFLRFMDAVWARNMDQYPEWATSEGKNTGDDRWTDLSLEAIEKREAQTRDFLRQLREIPSASLSESHRLDHELLLRQYEEAVEGQRFPGKYLALNQLSGIHQDIAELMQIVPTARVQDYENILKRLEAVPRLVDQHLALLQKGVALKITPPRATMRDVARQLDQLISQDSLENPILAPFRKESALVSKEQRDAYATRALGVFRNSVLPALRKYRAYAVDTYLPACRETIGLSALPDGAAWYAFSARNSTTVNLSPKEIHELGLREVARIRGEMESLIRQTGFRGDFQAFKKYLQTDPRFFYKTEGEILAAYRDISKRADAELPRFFGRLPRLSYGVKPIPAYAAPSKPTAYYESGSREAGRAAFFFANTYLPQTRPKWEMEALTLHEAVPGHHLQIALAQEMDEKHDLIRRRSYTAYVEGWALYCERLGLEMGFYTDAYSNLGRLTYELWRANRLVLDTGIHALGWSRDQAIQFFRENTLRSDHDVEVEVDRYIAWPAQALAYKIGELKIRELRQRAEKELGDRFNLRAFHDALLAKGALPLPVLEREIQNWIHRQQQIPTP